MFYHEREEPTWFEKDGKIILYDGCTSSSKEEGDEFYLPKGYTYIGEGNIIWFKGFKNVFKETHYFYKRK